MLLTILFACKFSQFVPSDAKLAHTIRCWHNVNKLENTMRCWHNINILDNTNTIRCWLNINTLENTNTIHCWNNTVEKFINFRIQNIVCFWHKTVLEKSLINLRIYKIYYAACTIHLEGWCLQYTVSSKLTSLHSNLESIWQN